MFDLGSRTVLPAIPRTDKPSTIASDTIRSGVKSATIPRDLRACWVVGPTAATLVPYKARAIHARGVLLELLVVGVLGGHHFVIDEGAYLVDQVLGLF